MRKLVKWFALWLYKRVGEPELLDIARYQNGIKAHLPLDLQGNIDFQDSQKVKAFLQWCHFTATSEYFEPFIGAMLKAQEVEIIENVATEKALLNARAARHGVSIVEEQFRIQADKYIALTSEKREEFNKFEVIGN